MSKPNVILLTIDTLRADHVSSYGHKSSLTPHLDRLAAAGVRFEQAITGGSWTQAAFPVLLTSSYASFYGGCLGPLATERPSPIQLMAENGYQTAGFTTSPLLSRQYGYARGFRHFSELIPHESDPALRRLKGGEHLLRHPFTHLVSGLVGKDLRPARLYVPAAELTDAVCGWVGSATAPYFVWAHYMDVHWPYHLEEKLRAPAERAQAWRDLAHLYQVNRRGRPMTGEQKERLIRLYEEAIQYTDAHVGRLLDFLETSGQLEDTIVVVAADHGEEFMERRHWGHFEVNLYDEIIRVPLVIAGPGMARGRVVDQQVSLLDIMPTVLDVTECPPLDGMAGTSLRGLLDGGVYEPKVAISEMWRDHRHIVAVRCNEHKYIWDSERPGEPQLFDLVQDPGEGRNVVEQRPQLAAMYQAHVDNHLALARETAPNGAIAAPDQDAAMLQRLADLGYVD